MYMIVLAVVGSMGLFWMAGFAVVLSIEKASGHRGVAFSKVVAVGLLGVAVILATRTLLAV
jgi:predicted metal-binding membrane protein